MVSVGVDCLCRLTYNKRGLLQNIESQNVYSSARQITQCNTKKRDKINEKSFALLRQSKVDR